MLLLFYYSTILLFYPVIPLSYHSIIYYPIPFHYLLVILLSTISPFYLFHLLFYYLLTYLHSSILLFSYPVLLSNISRLQSRFIYSLLYIYFSTSPGKPSKRENSLLNKLLYQIFKINNKLNSLSRIKSCFNLVDKCNLS